jgi:hypothetical protein
MATTYTHIATTELSSSVASVDFTSLGAYTDLVFYCQFATSQLAYITAQVGSGSFTTTGYTTQIVDTTPSAYVYGTTNGLRIGYGQANNGLTGFGIFELHQYRNGFTHKVMHGYHGHTSTFGNMAVSRLNQTLTVDRVKFFGDSGNLISGTKISVYGILAA